MKNRLKFNAVSMLAIVCAVSTSFSEENRSLRRGAVVMAVEKAAPAVVNISTEQLVVVRDPFFSLGDIFGDRYWDFFGGFPTRRYRATSLGAGVIVDALGYIVTNYHVVTRASKIQVTLSDKSTYLAELISFKQDKDIAMLKIDASKSLPYVKMGTSGDLMSGETVIAVGNPFGLGNSISVGVVSAVGRPFAYKGQLIYDDLIQTDASINPGNSGGPLLNINGELIGINMAIKVDAQGIGFAIPVDDVRQVLLELLSARRTRILWLGLELKERGKLGVEVTTVERHSPAQQAGLKQGDLILSVDGVPVTNRLAFEALLLARKPGTEVLLGTRRAGRNGTFKLKLKAPPKPDVKALTESKLGIQVQNLTIPLAQSLGIRRDAGILVTDAQSRGPAASAGIVPGDIIARVNNDPVRNIEEFGEKLAGAKGYLSLTYLRVQRRGPATFSRVSTVNVKLR